MNHDTQIVAVLGAWWLIQDLDGIRSGAGNVLSALLGYPETHQVKALRRMRTWLEERHDSLTADGKHPQAAIYSQLIGTFDRHMPGL